MKEIEAIKKNKKCLISLSLDPDMKTPLVYGHLAKLNMDIKKFVTRKKKLSVLVVEE